MSRLIEIDLNDKEQVALIAKALSVTARLDIINMLFMNALSIQEISQNLKIPASSVGVHVRILEEAGIIRTERQNINGSLYKLCHIEKHLVHIILRASVENVNDVSTESIPIGSYSDCYAEPHCGLISEESFIGTEDDIRSFYLTNRINAQIIWLTKGFLEYKAPNILPKHKRCKKITITMELCSEAPGFDEDYKSDIYMTINGKDCGFYRSNGDYGLRRGLLTPLFWQDGLSQYGKLVTWSVDDNGVFVNDSIVNNTSIADLNIENADYIKFRIENRKDSKYSGGINIFGEKAGDYKQPIILKIEH